MLKSSTTSPIRVVFFGSFLEYSVKVLEELHSDPRIRVVGVVTTPAKPAGRQKQLKKTAVHEFALKQKMLVSTPEKLNKESLATVKADLNLKRKPHFLVTAGYGKLIPASWLAYPHVAALNLHFSLLPKYRGANPAEWALLLGEKITGISIIVMSPKFDQGPIIAQCSVSTKIYNSREVLYEQLYGMGAKILPDVLARFKKYKDKLPGPRQSQVVTMSRSAYRQLEAHKVSYSFWTPPKSQPRGGNQLYAKRLFRQDGFLPWATIKQLLAGDMAQADGLSETMTTVLATINKDPLEIFFVKADFIERMTRALAGFPGVWTIIPTSKGEKRMKILAVEVEGDKLILDKVQIDGQQPATWNQVKNVLAS